MREILFRGKKQNGEWLYGDLVHYGDKILIFSENAQNSPDYYEVIPETVGQFTGLTDKNGVKIFEGDFLNVEMFKIDIGYFNSVFFCESIQNYKCISTEYQGNQNFIEDDSKYCLGNYKKVVIGNIHDNPELLK